MVLLHFVEIVFNSFIDTSDYGIQDEEEEEDILSGFVGWRRCQGTGSSCHMDLPRWHGIISYDWNCIFSLLVFCVMPASMHPGAQSWCMYKSVRLGATWIGGVLVPFSPYCVWLKLTVTVFDKCRHSSYRSIATNVEDYRRTMMQISRAGVLGWSLQMRNMNEQIGDWAHNAGGHSLSKVKMPASNSKICTKLYYESRRTFRLEQICFWGEPWSVRGC